MSGFDLHIPAWLVKGIVVTIVFITLASIYHIVAKDEPNDSGSIKRVRFIIRSSMIGILMILLWLGCWFCVGIIE